MRVLGVNALFHDPAAALVVDGHTVAAAEEERFSRRKHGKRPVPFAAWELPEQAARWCLAQAGLRPDDLDAVAYSFDPSLARPADEMGLWDPWDWLRLEYARRAPAFLATALPGLDPEKVVHVPHHVAHAASAGLAAPAHATGRDRANGRDDANGRDRAVLVLDGRGESASHLAGVYRDGRLEVLAAQPLPHSLGLLYEEATEHLGFTRASDEYKVMALASYGQPRHLALFREAVRSTPDGGFTVEPIAWDALAKRRDPQADWTADHADLAASLQRRLEEVLLDLVRWLHAASGGAPSLALAGGVALNCVANARIAREGPFADVWVQPAAGDAGTALGAALHVTAAGGVAPEPMPGADLGRGFSDDEIATTLRRARIPYARPPSVAEMAADGARGRRRGGLVPGAGRVRAAGPGSPVPAGPPGCGREYRAAQRGEGARAVPAGGAHGAGRAGRGDLRRRPAQPVHALHPPRP